MTLWQTSLTYQIWVWLCDVYEDSTLHRFLAAAGRWCNGQIETGPCAGRGSWPGHGRIASCAGCSVPW